MCKLTCHVSAVIFFSWMWLAKSQMTYWTLNRQLLISISNFNLLSFAGSGCDKKKLRKSSQFFISIHSAQIRVQEIDRHNITTSRSADNWSVFCCSLSSFLFWKVALKRLSACTHRTVHPTGLWRKQTCIFSLAFVPFHPLQFYGENDWHFMLLK